MEFYKYLIPEESIDVRIDNVATFREIEGNLRNIFTKNNYKEVLMPSFDYVELYTEIGCDIPTANMFRFVDSKGKNVALRYDFTVPLARLYTTKYQNTVARFCYFGKVYRKEKMHKGRSSEFYQAGVELINEPGSKGELEILEMLAETVENIPLSDVRIEFGSAAFLDRLFEITDDDDHLREILKYRNISELKKFIKSHSFDAKFSKLLLKLPGAIGDVEMLDEICTLVDDKELLDTLIDLKTLTINLDNSYDYQLDLGMVPEIDYYTGLMIKGYSKNAAKPIITGGRYDKLLPKFDADASAVGFCCHMNYILEAVAVEENND